MDIDWSVVRIQYELFGVSEEHIADEYGVSLKMVEYAKSKDNWQRTNLPIPVDGDDTVVDELRSKVAVLATTKFSALLPSYVTLEAAILGKCIAHARELDTSNMSCSSSLKTLSEVLATLAKAHGGADGGAGKDKEGSGITVKILNQVDMTTKDADNVIEIDITEKIV